MTRARANDIATTLVVAAMLLGTTHCGTAAPVLDISHRRASVDRDVIADAVLFGLAEKGWEIEEHNPGVLQARIRVDSHFAVIQIAYDDRSYTIAHVESSPSLGYDGRSIHKRYNRWVKFLDDAIQRHLSSAGR